MTYLFLMLLGGIADGWTGFFAVAILLCVWEWLTGGDDDPGTPTGTT